MALLDYLSGPVGTTLNTIYGWTQAEALKGQQPKAPNVQEQIPRGTFRPGSLTAPDFQPTPIPGLQALGPGQRVQPTNVGPQEVFSQYLQDEARRYEASQQRLANQQTGLNLFSENFRTGMQDYKDRTRGDYGAALKTGQRAFGGANQSLEGARLATDQALSGTLAATQAQVQDFKKMFHTSLAELKTAKSELLQTSLDNTAALMVDHALAVGNSVEAQLEGIPALNVPDYQKANLAAQIRSAGSRQVGDQLRVMATERAYQRDNLRLSADTNIANFLNAVQSAYGGVTQAALAERGKAYGDWAKNRTAISEMKSYLATNEANWRSSMFQNLSWLETQIREADLRGATIEKAGWELLETPAFELGPYFEGLLGLEYGEMDRQFAYDQAEFSNNFNISDWQMSQTWGGFDRLQQYRMFKEQQELQRDAMRYGIFGSAISGGSAVAGGFASNPNLFKSTPGLGSTAGSALQA